MTFRRRLTLSYAIASATTLTIFACAAYIAGVLFLTRSVSVTVQHTAEDVRHTVQRDAGLPSAKIVADLQSLRAPNEVLVHVDATHARPPHFPPRRHRGPPAGIWNPAALLGLAPVGVVLPRGGDVFIAADLDHLEAVLSAGAAALCGFEGIALLSSWLIGKRIARRAMRPLDAICQELERFGAGDFTPRRVGSTRSPDLDALVCAYNAAAAQVASAFAERARVEAEMRQFLAEAGHQMRTPLTVISGSLDLLVRRGADDAVLREAIYPLMHTQTARLRRLIERVMRLASLQPDEPALTEVVDVAEVARDVIATLCVARGCKVTLADEGTFNYVKASGDEIYDAIANLVDNASKYGRSHVAVRVNNAPDEVIVRVCDDGAEIPVADRPRLFERFFRGQNAGAVEGTGLGLAITQRAVERAGGTVALESSSAGGSTFRMVLPAFHETGRKRTAVALD